MATVHSSTSPENGASQSFNQDHIDDLLAHYAGLSQGSHEGRGFPPLRSQVQDEVPDYPRARESPRHFSAATNYLPPAAARVETGGNVVSTSWDNLRETSAEQAPSNYPTTAAEVLDILPLKLAYLSGGRDKEGLPIITFPAPPKNYVYNRDDIRRLVQYLASVPTEEVRQSGFCIILDTRASNWHTSKHILRTLQESLPGQINMVYIIEPAHFWSKKKAAHGHNKEKTKLEFSTMMVSDTTLTRYIEPNQLTEDVGGFLPYNHEQWIKLRQNLEHFISSYNALMEHNSRLELQLGLEHPAQDLESAEDVLSRHNMLQDQFKKAPQSAMREANDLLRSLEQGRDVAGTTSVTPDKINAVSVIKKLLDSITRRQQQLEDLWRTKKTSLEQALQLQVFEKSMQKVRTWLKTRGEETLASWTDIGTSQDSARAVQEQHTRFETKATSILNNMTQLRRMADRLNGSNHFAADSLQRQVAKVSNRFSRFEERLAERRKIVDASVTAHTTAAEWSSRCKEASSLFKEEATASDLAMVEQLLCEHAERMHQLVELASRASSDASNLLRLMESVNSSGGDSQLAQVTKTGPQYTSSIDHVRHLLENVEGLKKRLYELAEARKLRLEQYKQLFLCERDADQVTGLMKEMLKQVLSAVMEVGNSLQSVMKLLEEHRKFSDSAKKTYKYACDLLSTAQRSRKALKMDTQVNDALLSSVNTTWERLSNALEEGHACLEMSQQFHASLEEVISCYIRWTTPINQMPRSSEFAEQLSQEIMDGRDEWKYKIEKCLELGVALISHLQQPHPQAEDWPNEVLKHSLGYVRYRLEELEARAIEAPQVLDCQLGVLKDFATYCSFELGIEQVLMWLQGQGLKTIQSLPRLGDTEGAVKEQLATFEKFNSTCMELTTQVLKLHTQAAQTEALIRCFNSELVRKATSLKTVWEKFMARVVEWRDTLHAALKLFEQIGTLHSLLGELHSSLNSEAVSRQGRGLEAYLGSLTMQRQRLLSLTASLPLTRAALMKHQSVEHSIDTVMNIDRQLKSIEAQKASVEELWLNATRQLENEKMKLPRQLDVNGSVKSRELSVGAGDKSEKDELSVLTGDKSREEPVTKGRDKPVFKTGEEATLQAGGKQKVEPSVQTGEQLKAEPSAKTGDQSQEESLVKTRSMTTVSVKTGDEVPLVAAGESVRKYSLGSKVAEKPNSKAKLKPTLSSDSLDKTSEDKAKKDAELCVQLSTRTRKVLEWLEVECDGFLANNVQMGDTLETAEKLKTLHERFLESIQPSCLELSQSISELLSLKNSTPQVAQSVGETCTIVRDSVGKRRKELQERIEILKTFVSFCTLCREIESNMSKMKGLFSRELFLDSTTDSAQPLLDEYSWVVKGIMEAYPRCKGYGEKFMGVASPLLTRKGVAKMSVSPACIWTAMELGEMEGKYQLMLQEWEDKERTLKQIAEWQSFSSNAEQLTNWLTDPDTFLSNQTEFGTSAATAEDLLMEHNEFDTGAQRIASEVEALLLLSEQYLSSSHQHVAATSIRQRARELKALHNSFKAHVSTRHQGLLKSVAFFQGVEKLTADMENTVNAVREGADLHCSLRLPSALARHTALTREGDALVKMAGSLSSNELWSRPPLKSSSSPDTSEQVIRRTLEGLKVKLDQYREVLEGRQLSPLIKSQQPGGVKRQVTELVIQQKTSSPLQARKEGVSVASSPLQARKEGVSDASSPLQARKEGVSVASSPLQARKEGVSVASSPLQARKEGVSVASSPLQARKEGVSLASSPLHVNEVVAAVDGGFCAITTNVKFSACLTASFKACFTVMATLDFHVQVPRPLEPASPSMSSSTSVQMETSEDVHSSKHVSLPSLRGSPQRAGVVSFTPKGTPTKRHSLDSGFTPEGGNVDRNHREGTPPSGKVSSLRSMFNAMGMSKDQSSRAQSTPSPQPQTLSHSSRARSTPPPQPQTLTQSSRARSTPLLQPRTSSQSSAAQPTPPPDPAARFHSPDIIPMEQSSPNHAPPRPPSPVNYNPNGSGSGLLESDTDSLSTFASSADEEREEEEEVREVEETDNDGCGLTESKKTRSMSVVLSELKHTEQRYLKSLSVLAEGYIPRFNDQHLPTFLVGKKEALLANIDQIFHLHRNLSQVLSDPGSSVLDVCQCFTSNAAGFSAYVPFLSNLPRGLALLAEYGGTFFDEYQRDMLDNVTLEDHCLQPWERMVEYTALFREILACAEKECLHAVAAVKDALHIIHGVTRAVDNFIAVGSLKDCPFAIRPEGVVRRELFHVYKPTKKKKLKEVLVVLHQDHIILSQAEPKPSWRKMPTCNFVDFLDVHSLMLIETYKRRKERFALSNNLGNTENIFVLQPVSKDMMVKQLWIRDICRLLGITPVEALPALEEQHEQLPLFFRTSPSSGGDDTKEMSRSGSMKRRDSSKRASSLKRRVSGRDAVLARRDSKKRTALDDKDLPVANVQLGTFQSGSFHIAKRPANENMYVVVQPHLSRRDSFLSVREGQLVEVLESSGPNWLVMTVAGPGEMEAEGFLPASCLKRVGEGLQNSETARMLEGSGHPINNSDKETSTPTHAPSLLQLPLQPVRNTSFMYYTKASSDPQTTPGLRLEAGQPVEVLDSSDIRWWLVRNQDTMEEGMVAPSCLSRFPLSKLVETSSVDDLLSPSDKTNLSAAHFGSYEQSGNLSRTPDGVFSEINSPAKVATPCSTSEMSLKRTTPIPDLSMTSGTIAEHVAQGVFGFTQPRPLWRSRRSMSFPDLCDGGQGEGLEKKEAPSTHSLPGSLTALAGLFGEEATFMTKGVVASSSVVHPSGLQVLDPTLEEIAVHGEDGRNSVFVAVADFTPSEKSSIPLIEGQEVKVLNSSRPDWWLVCCLKTSKEGWVPATYLKRCDDMYRFPFLAASSGRSTPEVLTPQKGSSMTYVVTCDHHAEQVGQLTLTKGQQLQTLDTRRSDWWLCSTTASEQSATGWVRPNVLIPCISISEDGPQPSKLAVALADCLATQSGMIDIREGEVLEIIDNSRRDWCLVRRTTFREPSEGWVRTSFIRDCSKRESNNGGTHVIPWHTRTGSNDSDTPEQCESQASMLSPDTNIEPYEDENQRKEAMEKRDCVLSELLKTEKEYVDKLEYCVENYWRPMGDPSQPKALRTAQEVIFGNLVDIYKFHHDTFQHKLIKCQGEPLLLGDTFVDAQDSLQLYVSYCQSKSRALEAYREFISFFEDVRSQIKGRLELPDYLILPVQRITKYTLLLQDFQKCSTRAGIPAGKIELALDVTRGISASANAAIHLSMLEGQDKMDLGPLILQDTFGIQEGPKPFKERRTFLFKKGIVITRRKRDSSERESYVIKDQLMLSDISITQDMDKAKRNFIIYHKTTGTKFTLRATSSSVKAAWLQKANVLIKEMKGARPARPKSASESLGKSSSFLGRNSLSLKREASQRKQSLKAMQAAQATEELAPPGTKYIVMECIVMEGGDDVTLEPGDEVELVRMDGSGSLRVKSLGDPHSIEGNVPGNYLRRKDSVITGLTMAAAPRFTMNLSNLHLLYGTTATISCAFNGYPPPSVSWKHDDELVQTTSHVKVTSCPTSSVLELTTLDYEDMGYYTCYITNSMGSVLTSMALSLYGPPSQPPKPAVSNIHSSSVKLRWGSPAFDGTSPVTSYEVECLQEGFGEWHQIAQSSRNSYVVKTLEQNTSYLFRIVALNEFGPSKPSEPSDRVVTKAKGWLVSSPSIHKKSVHPELGKDVTDFTYDECDEGASGGALSPPFLDFGSSTPPGQTSYNNRISRRESFVNHYAILQEELGRGHFGIVYKCVDRKTNQISAAKLVRIRTKRKAEIRYEVDILKTVAGISPHVLELMGAFEKDRVLHIVTELIPDGELLDFILAENSLTERGAVFYLSQLLQGLEAIHQLNIAHLDIEPENLMLSGPVLKIIDFGNAKDCGTSNTSSISDSLPEFVSPDMLNHEPVTSAMDMWSVGVITYVLLTGISPFFADNLRMTAENIREAKYSLDDFMFEQISPEAKDFISSLLQKSPEQRLNASKALQHIWIKMLNTGSSDPVSSSPWPMPRLDTAQLKSFVARRKRQTTVAAVDNNYIFGQRMNSSLLSPSPMESEEVVLAAPVLWGGPSDLNLITLVGSSLSIEWHFGGTPVPSIVWEHNQKRLTPSERLDIRTEGEVASMTITDVARSDGGTYMCCAMNSVGTETRKVQVAVQDKPHPPIAISAIRLSGSSALVSWQPPSDTGNVPISGYALERQQVGLGTWESATSGEEVLQSAALIVENLLPNASYLFRVAALNQVGASPFSEPANLVVKVDSGDSESSTFEETGPSQDSVKEPSFETLYEVKQAISCGAFSIVSKCVQRATGATFASKCISFSLGESVVMKQYQIHQQSTHTRIVALVESFETDRDITMILEYLPGGDLASLVTEKVTLSELETSRFTRQAFEGLQYLHKSGIIHSNIRPDNILLNGFHTELKLTDFRLARSITPSNQFEAVPDKPDFMAPEAVELKPLTPAADIWSVGMLVLFMLLGKSLLLGSTNKETVANIRTCHWYKRKSEMASLSLTCRDFLLEKVLSRNPRRRIPASECLTYQWLRPQSVSSFIHSSTLSQDSSSQHTSNSKRSHSLSQDI